MLLYDWDGCQREGWNQVGSAADIESGCEGARAVIRLDRNSSTAASTLEVLPEYLLPPVLNHQILIGNAGIARLQPIQWDSNHHLVVKECPRAPGSWYAGQYLFWRVFVLEYDTRIY